MLIEDRLKRSIALRKDEVFLRSEFSDFGSPAQLSRALRHLISNGVLVKLGVGVFAKAKPSVLTGKPIPIRPLEVLAPLVLQKLGVKTQAGRAVREYNAGDTLQLPAGIVLDTGSRRINRKLGFGGRYVTYENHCA
ncbi:S-adenosylhomocysteine hydrolase [Pseudomonas sp. MWU13-2100]|uniref:S-adenosylhomocysteine hydrolase n=1 Tax=Pseudomonas sp. MWU13-2100 TaxID=2935075 RepID=UPI00200DDBA2|nr:S-adenosylhomocysteine hydrolase [Pseudomonas sp. MWU13-2100]